MTTNSATATTAAQTARKSQSARRNRSFTRLHPASAASRHPSTRFARSGQALLPTRGEKDARYREALAPRSGERGALTLSEANGKGRGRGRASGQLLERLLHAPGSPGRFPDSKIQRRTQGRR